MPAALGDAELARQMCATAHRIARAVYGTLAEGAPATVALANAHAALGEVHGAQRLFARLQQGSLRGILAILRFVSDTTKCKI